MSPYIVTSDRVAGHDKGDTVTAKDLPAGVNLDALVKSGHLKAKPAPKTTTKGSK